MIRRAITKRDLEILRTLVRVQLARTGSLQETFFRTLSTTRRRLRALRNYGLIDTHSKGLPGNLAITGGQYWRITESGLRLFAERFPNEVIPENLVVRTSRSSLRCFEHRDDMTDLYLRLVASQDQDIDEIRERADIVNWRGEHEVVLPYEELARGLQKVDRRIIPDATLTTADARCFLEVDRSTESLKRCKRVVLSYAKAIKTAGYASQFGDQRRVKVVYATKSRARAKNLRELVETLGALPMDVIALPRLEVVDWLNASISREPWQGDNTAKSYVLLHRLYDEARRYFAAKVERGELVSAPAVLTEVYEHLQAHQKERQVG